VPHALGYVGQNVLAVMSRRGNTRRTVLLPLCVRVSYFRAIAESARRRLSTLPAEMVNFVCLDRKVVASAAGKFPSAGNPSGGVARGAVSIGAGHTFEAEEVGDHGWDDFAGCEILGFSELGDDGAHGRMAVAETIKEPRSRRVTS